jgi:hypothetical protein
MWSCSVAIQDAETAQELCDKVPFNDLEPPAKE